MSNVPPSKPVYHAGMRELQDRFDTRALADRLDERLGRSAFTPEDRAFIESRPLFFLATADAGGQPDVSHKGGDLGFVRVTGDSELAFPSYDGNGMFRSLGNLQVNPAVALLFIDFERPNRLRESSSTIRCAAISPEPSASCACAPSASFPLVRATSTAWGWWSRRPTCRATGSRCRFPSGSAWTTSATCWRATTRRAAPDRAALAKRRQLREDGGPTRRLLPPLAARLERPI